MAYGLRVWNAAGLLTVDTSYRMGRILGIAYTGVVAGSIVVPGFVQGTPFGFAIPIDRPGSQQFVKGPTVTISGTTLSWTFDADYQQYKLNHLIYYGVR